MRDRYESTPRRRHRRSDNVLAFPVPTGTGAFAQDRASAATTAILQTIRQALLDWVAHGDADLAAARAAITALLREQFDDVARAAVSEIRREDG